MLTLSSPLYLLYLTDTIVIAYFFLSLVGEKMRSYKNASSCFSFSMIAKRCPNILMKSKAEKC